jgi:hypothetical protein
MRGAHLHVADQMRRVRAARLTMSAITADDEIEATRKATVVWLPERVA